MNVLSKLICSVTVLLTCATVPSLSAQVYSVGDTVENFALPACSNAEGTWKLYDYYWKENGGDPHVIFIDIFATWCNPCQEAAPETQEIYQDFRDRGLVVAGAGFDWGYPYSCDGWANTFGLGYPILDDGDKEGAWRLFGKDTPTTVVLDHHLKVIYHESGHNDAALRTVIDSALTAMEHSTEMQNEPSLPDQVRLHPAYPNPVNNRVVIRYTLPVAMEVRLSVYALSGRQIRTLVSGRRNAGTHTVQWDGRTGDGREVSSGIYLVRLASGFGNPVKKMTVLR